ncbi:DotU family type IV/VI secretion system protein [Mesoterricola silvestris]|uniref:Type VI secretion system protein ImpK n=1 Tax=Mesoterricola silvestris TaxID=2927979 RepID=A0AA48GIR6_9BACT|nr:DotU family type IV/VI secretion system protein [Mesoterricola silvestris]BDU73721.1 type VI secretion system protein ImpK [Mesoterricola silvestris]
MSEETPSLLLEEAPPVEVDLPIDPEPRTEEPAPGPDSARLIDGFLEVMAYTRYLVGGAHGEPVDGPGAAAQFRRILDGAEAFRTAHGLPEEAWREALFAVCAWADEQILCSHWEGRFTWGFDQLQRQLFDTTRAGEAFFERLEALPDEAWQVREVFLYCLGLGFQGRLFAPGDQATLRRIRAEHLRRLPRDLGAGADPHLFPDSGQTLPGELRRRHLPYRYLGYLVLAALPPALFLVAFLGFRTFLDKLVRPLLP